MTATVISADSEDDGMVSAETCRRRCASDDSATSSSSSSLLLLLLLPLPISSAPMPFARIGRFLPLFRTMGLLAAPDAFDLTLSLLVLAAARAAILFLFADNDDDDDDELSLPRVVLRLLTEEEYPSVFSLLFFAADDDAGRRPKEPMSSSQKSMVVFSLFVLVERLDFFLRRFVVALSVSDYSSDHDTVNSYLLLAM